MAEKRRAKALAEADRAFKKAEAVYQPILQAYRDRTIGDNEFLAARTLRDAALEKWHALDILEQ